MSTLLDKVNVGTTAGDGTGDTLRNAMVKVNHAIDRANVLTHQMNTISFIGDSIINYGNKYKFSGDNIIFLGSNAPDMTAGVGTFQFRVTDANVRWKAPGDTFGPWTLMVNGVQKLQSGTANKWATFYLPYDQIIAAYVTDTEIEINITGNTTYGYADKGFQNWVQILSGQRLKMLNSLGIIGSTTADGLSRINQCYEIDNNGDALPEGVTPRIVVIYLGVNDFYQTLDVNDAIQNIRDMKDYVIRKGSYPVVCTIPSVDPWVQEFNRGLKNMAFEDYRMVLADFMAATRDPLLTDGTMIGGNTDLHFSNNLAFLAGREIYTRLSPFLNGWGRPTSEFGGDLYNLCRNGALLGTGGTTSTGVTGTIADDYTIVRTGTVTVTASKENTTYFLPWQVMDCAGAGDGDTVTLSLNSSAYNSYATLASMGLVACDQVYADVEFESLNISNIASFTIHLRFFDGSASTYASSNFSADGYEFSYALPAEHNDGILKTPIVCVPVGTTHVSAEVVALFKTGGEGLFKVRAMSITKTN